MAISFSSVSAWSIPEGSCTKVLSNNVTTSDKIIWQTETNPWVDNQSGGYHTSSNTVSENLYSFLVKSSTGSTYFGVSGSNTNNISKFGIWVNFNGDSTINTGVIVDSNNNYQDGYSHYIRGDFYVSGSGTGNGSAYFHGFSKTKTRASNLPSVASTRRYYMEFYSVPGGTWSSPGAGQWWGEIGDDSTAYVTNYSSSTASAHKYIYLDCHDVTINPWCNINYITVGYIVHNGSWQWIDYIPIKNTKTGQQGFRRSTDSLYAIWKQGAKVWFSHT